MSGIGNLFEVLCTAYGRKNPVRDLFYRCFHKVISTNLVRKGNAICQYITILDSPQFENITVDERNAIMALADKTLDNTFNYLGSGDCKLTPINWGQDFKSGYVWDAGAYYKKYKQVDLSNKADVKVPRELSRSHFLLHLALAYRFTNDDKYARKAFELIENWIDNNPLMYSINWGCAMDVAIRAINWIWALPLLESYKVSAEISKKVNGSLYQHGWFIYRNLEGSIFGYNNNHYFSDIVGLLHIGLLFNNSNEGNKWFEYAKKEFFRELRVQILPCGMLYEGSTNYNRLVLELIIPSIILLKRNGYDIPTDIDARMESMFDFIADSIMPNGEMPIVGDQDNGRVLSFCEDNTNDYRYLLSLGALLYHRGDFKVKGNGYNAYCSLYGGDSSFERFNEVETKTVEAQSKLFRDAGFALMVADKNYLLFNYDNQGMYKDTGSDASHTHCDWFSFVLAVQGVPFIIDPGTYVYSSDAERRNQFRSTIKHNTITIDGQSQAEVLEDRLWSLKRNGNSIVMDWSTNEKADFISCEHNAYERIENGIIHNRSILFNKEGSKWTIDDSIKGSGVHRVDGYLYLDPSVNVSQEGKDIILSNEGTVVSVKFQSDKKCNIYIEPTEISKSYGTLEKSQVIHFRMEELLPCSIQTTIEIL